MNNQQSCSTLSAKNETADNQTSLAGSPGEEQMHSSDKIYLAKDMEYLSSDRKINILKRLGDEQLRRTCGNSSDFAMLIKGLFPVNVQELLDRLGNKHLQKIFEKSSKLCDALGSMSSTSKITLVDKLIDKKLLNTIVTNAAALSHLLLKLPSSYKSDFLDKLSNRYFKFLIKNADELFRLLAPLFEKDREAIVRRINDDILRSVICNVSSLNIILRALLRDNRLILLEKIGTEHLKAIISNATLLHSALEMLQKSEQELLVDWLESNAHLKDIIRCGDQLGKVFAYMSDDFIPFLDRLDTTYLQDVIYDAAQLKAVLGYLAETKRLAFFDKLGHEHLHAITQDYKTLHYLLHTLTEQEELRVLIDIRIEKSIVKELASVQQNPRVALNLYLENYDLSHHIDDRLALTKEVLAKFSNKISSFAFKMFSKCENREEKLQIVNEVLQDTQIDSLDSLITQILTKIKRSENLQKELFSEDSMLHNTVKYICALSGDQTVQQRFDSIPIEPCEFTIGVQHG